MTRYWIFNVDSCEFETCNRQAAFSADAALPVIISSGDEVNILHEGETKPWSEGDRYRVAGIEFDREEFEESLAWHVDGL
jgi:hypothetical protein